MSTILRALKRAEQDCPEQGNENGSSLKFNVRTTLDSRMQRQRNGFPISSKQVMFTMAFAIVIAAASYFLFFTDKNFQPELSPCEIVPQASFMAPAQKDDQKIPALPAAVQKNNAVSEIVSIPPVSPPVDETIFTLPKMNIKKIIPATISQPPSNQDQKKEPVDNNPGTDIMPMEDGILKIQAISWAEDPVDRIAVISNKIVGEGEFVQSYRIINIGKDEVILRLSNQDFKLSFKYR